MTSPSVLQLSLRYGAIIAIAAAVIASVVGLFIAGLPGLFSALAGVVLAAVFMGLTAASILVAERVSRERSTGTYFRIIVVSWALKLVAFFVVAFLVRDQPWLNPYLFVGSALVVVVLSLMADALAFSRARVPYVGDIALPGDPAPENRRTRGR